MNKFLKKLWVEFWWGKPMEKTPAEKAQQIRAAQQAQRAQIKHKKNRKKGKRK